MTPPLIDLQGRVRDRVREKRRRRFKIILIAVTSLAVLGGGGYALLTSPLFSAQKVAVAGASLVTEDEVIAAADVPMGRPLVSLNSGDIGRRVARLSQVARADVIIEPPSTVRIRVTERTLAFVVATDGGFAWIDPSGQRFHQTQERPKMTPLAKAKTDDPRLLADIGVVIGALPERITTQVDYIVASSRHSITLNLTNGSKIVWGNADDAALKGRVADSLAQANPQAKVIDVSAPTHPTTR